MIYSNLQLTAEKNKKGYGFVVAHDDAGRSLFVATTDSITTLEECRSLKGYDIERVSGQLTIVPSEKDEDATEREVYLILSSESQQVSYGDGHIMVPKDSRSSVLSVLNGSSDFSTETWDAVVVKVHKDGDIFRVVPSGFRSGNVSSVFYIVMNGLVYYVDQPYVLDFYKERGIKPPLDYFKQNSGGRIIVVQSSWRPI